MSIFILIILFCWGLNDALKHYKAEKYARKVVDNQDLSFLDFMFSSHPIIFFAAILLLLIIICVVFKSIF